jgi:hypothetical protein
MTPADLEAIAADCKALCQNGYPPVAVLSHTDPAPKKAGKVPLRRGWPADARKRPPVDASYSKALEIATNTGIACHGLRVVDVDCGDPTKCQAILALAEDILGKTIRRHRCNSPRFALLYRAADGEPRKVTLLGTTHSDDPDKPDKIEVLGNGQQVVALGTHPTGAQLEWTVSPLTIPRDQLPAITEDQVHAFLKAAAPFLGATPPSDRTSARPKRATNGHGDVSGDLAKAHAVLMAVVPADDREEWIEVGAALYNETHGSDEGREAWEDWSAKSEKYDPSEIAGIWDSFERDEGPKAGFGKIYHIAKQYGWKPTHFTADPGYLASVEADAQTHKAPTPAPPPPPPPWRLASMAETVPPLTQAVRNQFTQRIWVWTGPGKPDQPSPDHLLSRAVRNDPALAALWAETVASPERDAQIAQGLLALGLNDEQLRLFLEALPHREGTVDALIDAAKAQAVPADAPEPEPHPAPTPPSPRDQLLTRTSVTALLARTFPPEVHLLGSLVTHTTRMFLVGPTGTGKTNFGVAMACGIASRLGLLGWKSNSPKPVRVLWIDGEMPLQELQKRFAAEAHRFGYNGEFPNLHYISWQDADGLLPEGKFMPLNTEEGQDYLLRLIDLIAPDVVFLDNVQSLVTGNMKDEEPWNLTMPFVLALTARNIGQVWCDHTGHDQRRQYGASRKAWPFDIVAILNPLIDQPTPGELAFTLTFDPPGGKARRRTPENWTEYATRTIRLRDDVWSADTAPAPDRLAPDRRFGKLGTDNRLLFRTIQNLLAEGLGEMAEPVPGIGLIEVLRRSTVRDRLIRDGWFSEGELESKLESSSGSAKLTQKGMDTEAKALKALKDKGLIGFNRHRAWPASSTKLEN